MADPSGVTRRKGKWIARIQVDHQMIQLGTFDTREEAEESYQDAREHPYSLLKESPYAMTHKEIANELGITRQAVVQIEARALEKLRKQWVLEILGEYR